MSRSVPKKPILKVPILVLGAILSLFASLNAAWHCLEKTMGASALRGTTNVQAFHEWSDSSGRWFLVSIVLLAVVIAFIIAAVRIWRKSASCDDQHDLPFWR